jgi:hypothetical protein
MMRSMRRTIPQLIEAAGGPKAIEAATKKSPWPLKGKSVHDWSSVGIHERHWPALLKLIKDCSVEELFEANRKVRARPRPTSRAVRAEEALT